MKVIIATYLAILTADGIGNLFAKYVAKSGMVLKVLKLFSIGSLDKAEMAVKILLFVALLVVIVVRGGFRVYAAKDFEGIMGVIILMLFGFLSASLILSTFIVYISGGSFVSVNGIGIDPALSDFYQSSRLTRLLVNHYNVWFVLPAIMFILTSFFSPAVEEELD